MDQNLLKLDLQNYSGPIDVLLDLAKSQKVDLTDISITKLADQFLEFIKDKKIIIRSSSLQEDRVNISNAGKYKSFKNIIIRKDIIVI